MVCAGIVDICLLRRPPCFQSGGATLALVERVPASRDALPLISDGRTVEE